MCFVNNVVGNVAAHIVLRERGRALSNPRGLVCARWVRKSHGRMMLIRPRLEITGPTVIKKDRVKHEI